MTEPAKAPVQPAFFAVPSDFHKWLEEQHDKSKELWVGYYKVGSGKPSITWPESVDEALCFGWIDGLRKGIDGDSYMIRFTPRKSGSIWSDVNTNRVAELTALGRMQPAGLQAFEKRKSERAGVYSHEQKEEAKLSERQEELFRANRKAWDFFQSQPASYRKTAIWLIVSAKREETKQKRLDELIAESEKGNRIKQLTRFSK
ncbi:YdeI/OmpD-associated family protein [Paenibacillus contaminans]|uniref:YdeI/OmpD-associated family protein n=1 Tax=Paenibacillus contaminans TaxID=450362 RepID=UPI001EDE3184|nr:YdeI/OmpD-associated family protein [Paenibacillus contaminans]